MDHDLFAAVGIFLRLHFPRETMPWIFYAIGFHYCPRPIISSWSVPSFLRGSSLGFRYEYCGAGRMGMFLFSLCRASLQAKGRLIAMAREIQLFEIKFHVSRKAGALHSVRSQRAVVFFNAF